MRFGRESGLVLETATSSSEKLRYDLIYRDGMCSEHVGALEEPITIIGCDIGPFRLKL